MLPWQSVHCASYRALPFKVAADEVWAALLTGFAELLDGVTVTDETAWLLSVLAILLVGVVLGSATQAANKKTLQPVRKYLSFIIDPLQCVSLGRLFIVGVKAIKYEALLAT